jgi:hypothetical protein
VRGQTLVHQLDIELKVGHRGKCVSRMLNHRGGHELQLLQKKNHPVCVQILNTVLHSRKYGPMPSASGRFKEGKEKRWVHNGRGNYKIKKTENSQNCQLLLGFKLLISSSSKLLQKRLPLGILIVQPS